jgi:hypothetical protein
MNLQGAWQHRGSQQHDAGECASSGARDEQRGGARTAWEVGNQLMSRAGKSAGEGTVSWFLGGRGGAAARCKPLRDAVG